MDCSNDGLHLQGSTGTKTSDEHHLLWLVCTLESIQRRSYSIPAAIIPDKTSLLSAQKVYRQLKQNYIGQIVNNFYHNCACGLILEEKKNTIPGDKEDGSQLQEEEIFMSWSPLFWSEVMVLS